MRSRVAGAQSARAENCRSVQTSQTNLRSWRAQVSEWRGHGSGGSEQRYFVDCLLNQHPVEVPTSPRVARDTQEVIEAVYRSAELNRAIQLPLA